MNHEYEDDDALEGLFQEAVFYEAGGIVSTARLCDVLYWAMRGVPYTSTQGANNMQISIGIDQYNQPVVNAQSDLARGHEQSRMPVGVER